MSFFVPFYAAFYISKKETYISIYKSGHDKWSDLYPQNLHFAGNIRLLVIGFMVISGQLLWSEK